MTTGADVRDIASPESQAQAGDVRAVLTRLGVDIEERRILEVWNKSDQLSADAAEEALSDARRSQPPAILVSATTGEGVADLLAAIAGLVDEASPVSVEVSAGEGAALAWLYRHGRVIDRTDQDDGGVKLSVSLSAQALGQFEQQYPRVRVG